MAFLIKETLQSIQGFCRASGHFGNVMIGEPKSPPSSVKPTAAIYMTSASVIQLMMDGATSESHIVTLRIYRDMLEDSVEIAETTLAASVSSISEDLLGDYDLGATINHIDAAGMHGQGFSMTWGYISIADKMYRTVDIIIPLIVDGSATMAV